MADARYNLMLEIGDFSNLDLRGTNDKEAIEVANALVNPEEKTIVVFLTDNVSGGYAIGQVNYELHKVGIIRPGAAESLRDKFLPGQGIVHNIDTIDDLTVIMTDILASARSSLCLG
ncbi:MAG: hypothetical protein ACK4SL_03510 [Candidatus Paceibacteria bacterium]